jgi:hypothetical protein
MGDTTLGSNMAIIKILARVMDFSALGTPRLSQCAIYNNIDSL